MAKKSILILVAWLMVALQAWAQVASADILEVVVVLQQLHHMVFATEREDASGTACRTKQYQLVNRKILLVEHSHKLLSHSATCAHNSYFQFN